MKILELKILSPDEQIKRDILFNQIGISYIYGDIQKPQEQSATINSLGKTLLLKFIDYIFGANEDREIVKESIYGYILIATVLHNNVKYSVQRILGSPEKLYINGDICTLADYKEFFGIERTLYHKQFIIKKKVTEISARSTAVQNDVISYLTLLQLDQLIEDINNIYNIQNKIKSLKDNKKELAVLYGTSEIKLIDEEVYFVDKEVERVSKQLEAVSTKIKAIEVADIQKDVVEEYATKSKELKETKVEYERKRFEYERLMEFINSSEKADISSEHVLAIYAKAKQEVPEMVIKSIQEVEQFHKKVYEERRAFLFSKSMAIQEKMRMLNHEISALSLDINKLGVIISTNQVYKETIGLYEKYNSNLQELKFKQGKLSQVKEIEEKIGNEEKELTESFGNANQVRKSYNDLIQKYRDFIYGITKKIYDNDINSFFDIKVKTRHLTARPVSFEFSLKGDTGEGVNEVKKNLMDYLTCRYNTYMQMMIQDSACYNGIDPRQIIGMLSELDDIAKTTEKQVIIAINKYQLGGDEQAIEMVENRSVLTLSEDSNLLGFEF